MKHRVSISAAITLLAGVAIAAEPTSMTSAPDSSVNPFAWDLYRRIAKEHAGENVFFSPFSMASGLAMAAEGARGQTAEEMARVLHADRPRAGTEPGFDFTPLHADLAALNTRLTPKRLPPETQTKIDSLRQELDRLNHESQTRATDETLERPVNAWKQAEQVASKINELLMQADQYDFRSANALWGEKSFAFEKSYLDILANYYKTGGLLPVDFLNDPEAARQHINQWVSQQTNDRIKDLLSDGTVTRDTRLVLTNAVYFLGQWPEPFDVRQTELKDFSTLDGGKVKVSLMQKRRMENSQYAAFNGDGSLFDTPQTINRDDNDELKFYPANDGFQLAVLPYKGGDVSVLVILPRDSKDGLDRVERLLSSVNVTRWTSQLQERKINLLLPKFKLENSYDMIEPLQALGMKRAFVNAALPDGAQFDGISNSSDPSKRLYIGVVAHKAFVSVDEQGTKAAAATGLGMAAASAMPREAPFVPTFRADHSFVVIIRENRSGAILFMGRLVKPAM